MTEKQLNALQLINNKSFRWYYELTTEDLLSKDNEGKTILEHAIDAGLNIPAFMEVYSYSLEILDIFIRTNKLSQIGYLVFTEEQLYSNFQGKLLIDYLLEINECNNDNIKNISHHYDIFDKIINSEKYFNIHYLNENIINYLTSMDSNGTYKLEQYINNDRAIEEIVKKISNPKVIIDLYNKYKKVNILKNINETVALCKVEENKTLFEFLLEHNIDITITYNMPCNKELIDVLIKLNRKDLLEGLKEEVLVQPIEGSKTVLQYILENSNIKKLNLTIFDEKTLKLIKDLGVLTTLELHVSTNTLNKKGQLITENGEKIIDFLINSKANFKLPFFEKELCKKLAEDDYLKAFPEYLELKNLIELGVLEQFISKIKIGDVKYNLASLSLSSSSMEYLALYYITLSKLDMISYIKELKEIDLLEVKGGKVLLDELLKLDKELTVEKVIVNEKDNPKIAAILKAHGINTENINVAGNINNPTKDYKDKLRTPALEGPIPEEGEQLLTELEALLKNDGLSSPELVGVLITGYRNGLIQYYDFCLSEIKNLIRIKKENPKELVYIMDEKDGCFLSAGGEIHTNLSLETIVHETGHALHHYLKDSSFPPEYDDLKRRLRENPSTFERLTQFIKETEKIKESVDNETNNIMMEVSTTGDDNNIDQFLSSDLEKKKEELSEILGYIDIEDDTIDQILGNMYTVEQYNSYKKHIIAKELKDQILRKDYPVYLIISDIFDSIYQGKFKGEVLVDANGKTIKQFYGHGIPYFSKVRNGFQELVAEFSSLLKLPNANRNIAILKKYIGEEMFQMVSNYYYNNIVLGTYDEHRYNKEKVVIEIEQGKSL